MSQTQSRYETDLIGGRYKVQTLLGRGGMAVVYQVLDTATKRKLALKQLTSPQGGKKRNEIAEFFEHEYHVLSELAHPRVIEVYDFGVDDGRLYYTMELLDGGDLRELSPLPWKKACSFLRDVCSALSLLHSRRQIHRDLTPRNIRCTHDGKAKLIDFGAMVPMGHCKGEDEIGTFRKDKDGDDEPEDDEPASFVNTVSTWVEVWGRSSSWAPPSRAVEEIDPDRAREHHLRLAEVFEKRGQEEFRVAAHLLRAGEHTSGIQKLVAISRLYQEAYLRGEKSFSETILSLPPDWVETFEFALQICKELDIPIKDSFLIESVLLNLGSNEGRLTARSGRTSTGSLFNRFFWATPRLAVLP